MKAIPAKTKPIKHSNLFIFLGILAGLLLIGGVIAYKYVVDYYIPMQQLDQASKDLRPIYDKLLAENKGNIVSSHYRDECSYSYTSLYEKKISCGARSNILLNTKPSRESVLGMLDDAVSFNPSKLTTSSDDTIYRDLYHDKTGVKCSVIFGQMNYGKSWGYSLGCRLPVKNFLPGYQIVD